MPRSIYETFVRGYSEKQWGVAAHQLSADLCKRFDVCADDNPYPTPHHRFQGIPSAGYAAWMKRMLEGIEVRLDPSAYEYPFPDRANAELYSSYRRLVPDDGALLICGRLGEYRYYDMDQAIGRALLLGERLLAQ